VSRERNDERLGAFTAFSECSVLMGTTVVNFVNRHTKPRPPERIQDNKTILFSDGANEECTR